MGVPSPISGRSRRSRLERLPEELIAEDELEHEHSSASPKWQAAEVQGPREREEDRSKARKCSQSVCVFVCAILSKREGGSWGGGRYHMGWRRVLTSMDFILQTEWSHCRVLSW